ncbi:hypothetical protein ACLQ18_43355 [Streptomyces sp. DT193]|uniref:hypothetical protein n=1 Tax=Streptomyces sp. DT193 TaxID=3393418 RepID=UPI003CF2027F
MIDTATNAVLTTAPADGDPVAVTAGTVIKPASATTMASSPNPSTVCGAVAFTAMVGSAVAEPGPSAPGQVTHRFNQIR